MLVFMQKAQFEIQSFFFVFLSEFDELLDFSLDLTLQDICLYYNDSLRFEDLVGHDFSFAMIIQCFTKLYPQQLVIPFQQS